MLVLVCTTFKRGNTNYERVRYSSTKGFFKYYKINMIVKQKDDVSSPQRFIDFVALTPSNKVILKNKSSYLPSLSAVQIDEVTTK